MRVRIEEKTAPVTGRHQFLLTGSLVGAALGAESAGAMPAAPHGEGAATYVIDDTSAVADTESGKVVGYIRNDIRIFKGIPYAEIHSPEGCWMRGARTKPWTGRRSSRAAGLVCPQDRAPEPDGLLDEVVFRGTGSLPTHPGEDCHGGGLTGVSSLAAIHYEFANLAEHGDVVVVSINHRLSCFGFLGLTGFGERFAESAGLGMLDVVDALELEM